MNSARAAARTRLRRQRLLAGPVGRVLFALSWPVSLGLFSVIAFNIVDTLYIGRLGPDQLAAIGYCFPVIFSMSAVSIGMANGATSVVSRSLGRGDADRARIRTTDTIIFTGILSLLMTGGMFLIDETVFGWLGTPQRLMPFVHQYMNVWFLGLPFLMMPIVLNGLIRATGDAIFPSSLMIMAAAINAVISPFLVFGIWGAPDLGMAGAAWATIMARGVVFICSFVYLQREKLVEFTGHDFGIFRSSVAEITRFGAPAFFAQLVSPLSAAIGVRLLTLSSTDAVAAYTVGTRIESLMLVPFMALSSGIGPFTGQNIGAGKPHRLRSAQIKALIFSLGWGLVVFAILTAFGSQLAGLFSKEASIVGLADHYLSFIALGVWGAGFLHVSVGVANPLGYPNLGMTLSIIRHLLLFAGLSLVLILGFGTDPFQTVIMAGPAAYIVAGLFAALMTRRLIVREEAAMARSASAPS
ncbi:MATE family efflux transporter [Parvularcula marina]|uniref:MATE family efflux transporter n=1 Tax=Parvularcula marina TaxID=2292771 RepID=UPI003518F699